VRNTTAGIAGGLNVDDPNTHWQFANRRPAKSLMAIPWPQSKLLTHYPFSAPFQSTSRLDPKLAQPFIYKSVSEETRTAHHRPIREFSHCVWNIH
jgi:hypothetical protein